MSDSPRLADILERIDRIERATVQGPVIFLESEVIQDAVIHNLVVIGEAAKALTAQSRAKYPSIPWREMARFKDLAVHHYGSVLAQEVWQVVVKDLPAIRIALGGANRLPPTTPHKSS
jgi:uncharacterized protein with HEPN domain